MFKVDSELPKHYQAHNLAISSTPVANALKQYLAGKSLPKPYHQTMGLLFISRI